MEPIEILAVLIASFAGGVVGAALRIAAMSIAGMEFPGYTFEVAFGAFFGPYITFAAGAAAAAYAAKQGYFDPGFGGNRGARKGNRPARTWSGTGGWSTRELSRPLGPSGLGGTDDGLISLGRLGGSPRATQGPGPSFGSVPWRYSCDGEEN